MKLISKYALNFTHSLYLATAAGALVCLSIMYSPPCDAGNPANPSWAGPYIGVSAGVQNIFGGSLIDGVDVLAEGSRMVASLVGGYRFQFSNGLVIGFEAQLGATDADLNQVDPATGFEVHYRNDSQFAIGGILGFHFGGARNLFYVYAYETERDFDVTIQTPAGEFRQSDEQGALRYGLGYERAWHEHFRFSVTGGLAAADFGSDPTNGVDVEDDFELMLGLNYQF